MNVNIVSLYKLGNRDIIPGIHDLSPAGSPAYLTNLNRKAYSTIELIKLKAKDLRVREVTVASKAVKNVLSLNGTTRYLFDHQGRLEVKVTQVVNGEIRTVYTHDGSGKLLSIDHTANLEPDSSGTRTTYKYDANGALQQIAHSRASSDQDTSTIYYCIGEKLTNNQLTIEERSNKDSVHWAGTILFDQSCHPLEHVSVHEGDTARLRWTYVDDNRSYVKQLHFKDTTIVMKEVDYDAAGNMLSIKSSSVLELNSSFNSTNARAMLRTNHTEYAYDNESRLTKIETETHSDVFRSSPGRREIIY